MNKINKISLLFCLIGNVMIAQNVTIKKVESKLLTHEGVEFDGKLINKSKDLHMFKDWKNNGVIYIDGNTYRISNINFNVSTNQIDSQMKDGKYFIYQTKFDGRGSTSYNTEALKTSPSLSLRNLLF